ncbi:aminoacyl-tRNA hydrolase [Baaleninema sp.]|uniref:aminoacyl-tRNA hydrolase n=1 Tax=Baaleninema sp. TaxID=3101197 RepID=UPI003D05DBAC
MTSSSAPPKILTPQLIVGLGNPGPKYDRTRHNIGFTAVEALARSWQIPLSEQRKFKGEYGEGTAFAGQKIRLLKPLTYMNRSGESIQAVVNWYKLPPESVLIVYDDMDLPVGRIRLRLAGSAGGHNGMKSTISHLGTQNFPRLRVGIGRPKPAADGSVSHVLGKFSPRENEILSEVLYLVRDAIEVSLKEGVEKAMSLYNSRNLAESA